MLDVQKTMFGYERVNKTSKFNRILFLIKAKFLISLKFQHRAKLKWSNKFKNLTLNVILHAYY